MSLGTRDMCLTKVTTEELPYLARAFHQTTNLPQFGIGGNYGLTQMVNTESALTMPYYTRTRAGCTDVIEYDPDLIFSFLPTVWQQPDFRIYPYGGDQTRMQVKDMCRTRKAIDDMGPYSSACPVYLMNQPMFVNKAPPAVEKIFNDRFV